MDKLDLGLTQNGISGRKFKLGRLHNISRSISECFSSGIKTFVSVGNDETASKLLNSLQKAQNSSGSKEDKKFTFAVIPIGGKEQLVANSFGCKSLQDAARFLAMHRTRSIDLGLINDRHYFISAAVFPKNTSLVFLSYSVSSLTSEHQIGICNSNIYHSSEDSANQSQKKLFSMSDGFFEAVIASKPKQSFVDKLKSRGTAQRPFVPESVFPIKEITINGKQKTVQVIADTQKQMSTPVRVEVVPEALTIVVGEGFK